MTFLATLLALSPIAFGGERGNEANVPLARAVVGGLCSSTFLTLFLIPVLYTLFVKNLPAMDALEDSE
jgi:HAE1 family hydrophobic/amphiphilic exporter-1